jgi:hypothetical protein
MTLEKANEIRKLLNLRDYLISELDRFKNCDSITGNINRATNGLGFKWEKEDRQIKYLIDGATSEISKIEQIIADIEYV